MVLGLPCNASANCSVVKFCGVNVLVSIYKDLVVLEVFYIKHIKTDVIQCNKGYIGGFSPKIPPNPILSA